MSPPSHVDSKHPQLTPQSNCAGRGIALEPDTEPSNSADLGIHRPSPLVSVDTTDTGVTSVVTRLILTFVYGVDEHITLRPIYELSNQFCGEYTWLCWISCTPHLQPAVGDLASSPCATPEHIVRHPAHLTVQAITHLLRYRCSSALMLIYCLIVWGAVVWRTHSALWKSLRSGFSAPRSTFGLAGDLRHLVPVRILRQHPFID